MVQKNYLHVSSKLLSEGAADDTLLGGLVDEETDDLFAPAAGDGLQDTEEGTRKSNRYVCLCLSRTWLPLLLLLLFFVSVLGCSLLPCVVRSEVLKIFQTPFPSA